MLRLSYEVISGFEIEELIMKTATSLGVLLCIQYLGRLDLNHNNRLPLARLKGSKL